MKLILSAALILATSGATLAGELLSGSHTYSSTGNPWYAAPGAGYNMLVMTGQYTPISGPVPESGIECRGTNYWSPDTIEADGVCVFGDLPDRWMLRYRMTDTQPREQRRERFGRRGEWTIVGGVGRFEGMTGQGTYLAEPGWDKDGKFRTMWEGEVSIPD